MFSLKDHARQQASNYIALFPEEEAGLRLLMSQLSGDEDIFSRANMRGHVTTSALVYDSVTDMILTIFHHLLQRTLQPGGHQEGDGPLSESSRRETAEETGARTILHPWHATAGAPLDIDTHDIPAQPRKNEGDHYHHDFIYLFTGDSTKPLIPQLAEVRDAKWMPRELFRALPGYRFPRLVRKLDMVYGLSDEPTPGRRVIVG